jgi:hypothetical protein
MANLCGLVVDNGVHAPCSFGNAAPATLILYTLKTKTTRVRLIAGVLIDVYMICRTLPDPPKSVEFALHTPPMKLMIVVKTCMGFSSLGKPVIRKSITFKMQWEFMDNFKVKYLGKPQSE